MDDKIAFVYALCCPEYGEFKYVGSTTNLTRRYNEHCTRRTSNLEKDNWIETLEAYGLKPELFVLETTNSNDCLQLEVFWINKLKDAGYTLYNIERPNTLEINGITQDTFSNMETELSKAKQLFLPKQASIFKITGFKKGGSKAYDYYSKYWDSL